jgi:hypothetical protein
MKSAEHNAGFAGYFIEPYLEASLICASQSGSMPVVEHTEL